MRRLCGRQQHVEKRIDKIIVDGTGEMRQLRNTVFLEGSHCGCSHVAFGGCPRDEYVYWREVLLWSATRARADTPRAPIATSATPKNLLDVSGVWRTPTYPLCQSEERTTPLQQ